jgi:hypothetical protein
MKRSLRRVFVAGAALIATFIGALAPATANDFATSPPATSPPVQVSDTSPFGGCTADNVLGQLASGAPDAEVFPDSEVEPWIDVNPTDEDNLVGMWQQDRWSNGGARGHVVGVSFDGGSNWSQVSSDELKVTACSGATEGDVGYYQRTTDPWVSFGPDGTVHQISLSFNDIEPFKDEEEDGFDDFDHALLASKSDDGGLTWTPPQVVIRDTDANFFNDKQTITADPEADPRDPQFGNVYAVWDRLVFPPTEAASVRSSFTTAAFRGPIWFNRSTDNGDSWDEDPRQIYDPGQNDQTIANQIVVRPNGTLVNLFAEFNGENKNRLKAWTVRVLLSDDAGDTWSAPITVDRLQTIGITDPDVTDPEVQEDVRTGDIIPDVAVNPNPANGNLYAVWQDARFSDFQNDSIAFSQSDDGVMWSDPIPVNATPPSDDPGNEQAFTASVDVAADGTIAVTYYDFRNNTPAADLKTDYWVIHCHPPGCQNAGNWHDEERLTDTSFDMRQAPDANGFFTGDYEGLANAGNDFTPFFSQTHGTDSSVDPSSVFFRRVVSPP